MMFSSPPARHRPKKRFGQHFLRHEAIISTLMQAIDAQPLDKVIEIGPGTGALTWPLLRALAELTVIEMDRDLQQYWRTAQGAEHCVCVAADALTVDYSQWGEAIRLVGNLPYNISTPLLFHVLTYGACITDMHFMLQKEVVLRLVATPESKAYGRLAIMVQSLCEVTELFDVPPEAFDPPPKVNSAVVRLIPYKVSPYPAVCRITLERLVARAFGMRRKTLLNNLKPWVTEQDLKDLHISASARPEQIALIDYIHLANALQLPKIE